MSEIFLVSHGMSYSRKKIWIPRGMVVHFYAKSGERADGMAILHALSGAQMEPAETVIGPAEVDFMVLRPHSAEEVAASRELAARSPGGRKSIINAGQGGVPGVLCSAPHPAGSSVVEQAVSACSAEGHHCTGILGRIGARTVLHIGACRNGAMQVLLRKLGLRGPIPITPPIASPDHIADGIDGSGSLRQVQEEAGRADAVYAVRDTLIQLRESHQPLELLKLHKGLSDNLQLMLQRIPQVREALKWAAAEARAVRSEGRNGSVPWVPAELLAAVTGKSVELLAQGPQTIALRPPARMDTALLPGQQWRTLFQLWLAHTGRGGGADATPGEDLLAFAYGEPERESWVTRIRYTDAVETRVALYELFSPYGEFAQEDLVSIAGRFPDLFEQGCACMVRHQAVERVTQYTATPMLAWLAHEHHQWTGRRLVSTMNGVLMELTSEDFDRVRDLPGAAQSQPLGTEVDGVGHIATIAPSVAVDEHLSGLDSTMLGTFEGLRAQRVQELDELKDGILAEAAAVLDDLQAAVSEELGAHYEQFRAATVRWDDVAW